MIAQIQDSNIATFVSRGDSRRRTIQRVIVDGMPVFVVYVRHGAFVTALKADQILEGLYIVSTIKLGLPHGKHAPVA